eukprot:UN13550
MLVISLELNSRVREDRYINDSLNVLHLCVLIFV